MRMCGYCGQSLQHEGGVKANGDLFCSEDCADRAEHQDARAGASLDAFDRGFAEYELGQYRVPGW